MPRREWHCLVPHCEGPSDLPGGLCVSHHASYQAAILEDRIIEWSHDPGPGDPAPRRTDDLERMWQT